MADAPDTYGVREFTGSASVEERHAEEIRIVGYTVLPDVFTADEMAQAAAKIDEVYLVQLEEVGGAEALRRIGDEYIARAPLAYDDVFLEMATKRRIMAVVEHLLAGGYVQLMLQNAIVNVPSAGHQQAAGTWHRDLNYQHFVSSRPLSVSALVCVDAFTPQTGATWMLPSSHRVEAFPSAGFVDGQAVQVQAPAGSVIVFDSMLFHRTGINSSSRPRRGVNHVYTIPLLKQQIDLPAILGGRHADDQWLRGFLGYESRPDPDVREFRLRRLAR